MARSTVLTPFKTIDERRDSAPPHPGEVLREDVLPHFGLSRLAAARRLDIPLETLEAILDERADINSALASRLNDTFGLAASFWLSLQLQVDLWRQALDDEAADIRNISVLDRALLL